MKDMYDIVPRGNEYIYGKILLDNFNVCHSCRQFYPIDRCPDAVLADPKLLSKKSVYDFIISDMVYNHHFTVRIAKKSFLIKTSFFTYNYTPYIFINFSLI